MIIDALQTILHLNTKYLSDTAYTITYSEYFLFKWSTVCKACMFLFHTSCKRPCKHLVSDKPMSNIKSPELFTIDMLFIYVSMLFIQHVAIGLHDRLKCFLGTHHAKSAISELQDNPLKPLCIQLQCQCALRKYVHHELNTAQTRNCGV